jgi:hypothetical protein
MEDGGWKMEDRGWRIATEFSRHFLSSILHPRFAYLGPDCSISIRCGMSISLAWRSDLKSIR